MVDYYEGRPIDSESLEKLHKPAQRLLEKKDMDDEDKLDFYHLSSDKLIKTPLPPI